MNEPALKARALLAGALEMEIAALGDDASIETEERWDSLAHLRVIEALEEALGRELDPMTIISVFSLSDIETILNRPPS